MTIKNRLKYWRKRLKMTQEEFARFTGFTQSNVSHWEGNRVLGPENALEIMNKLRVVFPGIHMEDLYEGKKSQEKALKVKSTPT